MPSIASAIASLRFFSAECAVDPVALTMMLAPDAFEVEDDRTHDAAPLHLAKDFPARHIGLLHLKAGLRAWNKAADAVPGGSATCTSRPPSLAVWLPPNVT